ncbi:sulfotransferase [Sphingopyxis sp. XHP0097]|uniref:Sulfotransferase n=1 Tax=Sphingopyxis jiangsuensis TaxID=2871171 RepID=A0ABS7MFM5_9SPHN|nr:sulfotransferase [Sphingopyxis jiangsuensis]MBY4637837.1 sulfotransferase [Sphingopyxis jiangsuensis]
MTGNGTVTLYPMLGKARELADAGRFEEAAQAAMAHLRRYRDDPAGLALLGEIAMHLGALMQAEHFIRRALAADPADRAMRGQLASVLSQQERLDEAARLYADLRREHDESILAGMHANVLERLGRSEEARALIEPLAKETSDRPHYWISYGHNLRAAGRVDDAVAAYRKAIELDEECGEAWWGLASIKRRVFADADLDAMRRAIAIAIDVRNSAPLHFALARALHDRGDHAAAFEHYAEGNRQRAEDIGYDASELTGEIAEIEKLADAPFLASLDQPPVGDATPIFIVSLPRSGSTLLEQMLGSHPAIEPVGELPYAPAILRSVMELATRRGRVTVPQLIAGLQPEQAAAMGADYLARAALHRRTDAPFFIDKLPHNWSNILFLRRILPQAKFLDIRRPAMDCCFSNFTQSFSRAHAASFRLEDIGQCYVDYVRLMAHLDRVAPGMVHHIDYAALVDDPEPQLRATLAHLGLDWDAAILEFHKLDRVVRTPSSEQVRRPLNRDGMEVWRPYAEWLGPLRDVLGPLAD